MKTRLPFVFIIVTMLLNSIGIGLILPVMPSLLMELRGGSISDASLWGGLLTTTYASMQFLFSPLMGNLSDRFGRRPVLLISLFALGLDYVLLSVSGTIWLLFIGRLIAGITGATYSTANAYMADISKPEKRAANFGIVGAAFGVGFIIGPAIGGLLGEYGSRAPFIAAAILSLVNVAFGYFVLPETVTDKTRRAFDLRRANPLGALASIRRIPHMSELVFLFLLFTIAHQSYQAVWSYFTIEQFNFTPRMIGVSLGVFGLFMAIMQGGVIRVALPKLGELRAAQYAMILNVTTYILVAFIPQMWMLFALMPFMTLGIIAGPALQGIMANSTPNDAQGELQGIFASVNGLAMIISPIVMTGIFRVFTDPANSIHLPGAPFLAAAVLEGTALVLLVRVARKFSPKEQSIADEAETQAAK